MNNLGSYTIDELFKMYDRAKGLRIYNFIHDTNFLFQIHNANTEKLDNLIKRYEQSVSSVQERSHFVPMDKDRESNRRILGAFFIHLHNYCSSFYTINEQYKEFLLKGKYGNAPFDKEIGRHAMEIKNNPDHIFMFALRNCFVHATIPEFKIGVRNANEDDTDDSRIITSGHFSVDKSFFLREVDGVLFGEIDHMSKFNYEADSLRILRDYVRFSLGKRLSIDFREVFDMHKANFIEHHKVINNVLIEKYSDQYCDVKKLHAEIIKRQDTLRKGIK